jgi:hypothetical protein
MQVILPECVDYPQLLHALLLRRPKCSMTSLSIRLSSIVGLEVTKLAKITWLIVIFGDMVR